MPPVVNGRRDRGGEQVCVVQHEIRHEGRMGSQSLRPSYEYAHTELVSMPPTCEAVEPRTWVTPQPVLPLRRRSALLMRFL